MDLTCREEQLLHSGLCTLPCQSKRRLLITRLREDLLIISLVGRFIGTTSIRWVRLVHRFSLLRHCIIVCFVRIIAAVVKCVRCSDRVRTSRWMVGHFWVVLMVPTFRFHVIRWVLNLRRHDWVSRWLHNVVVFRRRASGWFMFMNDCRHRWSWRGARRRDAYCCRRRWRWRWELWWAFWIVTCKYSMIRALAHWFG